MTGLDKFGVGGCTEAIANQRLALPVTNQTLVIELSALAILLDQLSLGLKPIVLVSPMHATACDV
jgi:hypothetical protein